MNELTLVGSFNQTFTHNATIMNHYFNETNAIPTTTDMPIADNATIADHYFNETNSFPTMADMPPSGLTYALFGLTCLVTVFGLVGNSSILVIMVKFRETQMKVHDIMVTALAIFDVIALIPTAMHSPAVYTVIGRDIRAITTVGCKVFMSIWQSASVSSFTVVVLICIERFVAVWYPLRARYLFTRQLVLKCLLIGTTAVVIMYSSLSVLYCETDDDKCRPNFAGNIYSSVLKTKPNTLIYNGLIGVHLVSYLVILFTFTPMIIGKLYQKTLIRRQLTTRELEIGHFRVSVKLTSVAVAFVLLVALPVASALIGGLTGTELIDRSQSFFSWLMFAMLLNPSANFVLYNIFDKEFRRNALRLFRLTKEPMSARIMKITNQESEQAETSLARKTTETV